MTFLSRWKPKPGLFRLIPKTKKARERIKVFQDKFEFFLERDGRRLFCSVHKDEKVGPYVRWVRNVDDPDFDVEEITE